MNFKDELIKSFTSDELKGVEDILDELNFEISDEEIKLCSTTCIGYKQYI